MTDKVEELALPSAVITRILKDAIPEGINISKEARSAVSRAAAIFVLYATACASQVQATSQRKTLTINDVYSALEDMLFEDMIDPVKESLEAFHVDKGKKESVSSSPSKANSTPKPKRKRSQSAASKESETPSVIENFPTDIQVEEHEIETTVEECE